MILNGFRNYTETTSRIGFGAATNQLLKLFGYICWIERGIENMDSQNVASGSPMEKPIGFSRATRVGNRIAVAGTAAIGPDGQTVGVNNVYEQTKYCIGIMKKAIEEAGGLLQDVVRTRIMLVDINTWKEAAKAHGEFFSDIRPACTFFGVKGFINKEWLVETEADCELRPKEH